MRAIKGSIALATPAGFLGDLGQKSMQVSLHTRHGVKDEPVEIGEREPGAGPRKVGSSRGYCESRAAGLGPAAAGVSGSSLEGCGGM